MLIPAHNEEAQLGTALESVLRQSRRVDRIIVVSDNSTDRTVQIARRRADRGVEVIETVDNSQRKAGALNQVLAWLLPSLSWSDAILEMDADTMLTRRYVERAEARLTGKVGAVGPAYTGRPDGGLLGVLQRNEYARFNRQIARRRGRTPVLSGTATLASVKALRSVLHGRQTGRLPNGPGWGVYNPTTGTEDYELTLCLRRLGYRPVTPANCGVITDVMDTLGKWHGQRLRWYWGAMTNLRQHGLNRITVPYFASIAATFGLAIEHVASRGIVVSIATQSDDETVTFQAACFDRAKGARIYTLNLPDELASHGGGASDLTRLCTLMADGRLDGQIELEASWREPSIALDALLERRIGGKAVLNVD